VSAAPPLRLGLATACAQGFADLDDLLDWAVVRGLESIELNVADRAGDPARGFRLAVDALEIQAPVIRTGLAARALTMACLAPMGNPLVASTPQAAASRRLIERCIDLAPALGTRVVKTFAGSSAGQLVYGLPGMPNGDPRTPLPVELAAFAEVFGALAERAAPLGVRIALETAPRGGGEDKLAHAPWLWAELFQRVPSAALGLAFDPSRLVWETGDDPTAAAVAAAARIVMLNASVAPVLRDGRARAGISGDNGWRTRMPGAGSIDWAALLRALCDAGFRGDLVIGMEDDRTAANAGIEAAALHLLQVRRAIGLD